MILLGAELDDKGLGITRTCGGDPSRSKSRDADTVVLPAHAGVILNSTY